MFQTINVFHNMWCVHISIQGLISDNNNKNNSGALVFCSSKQYTIFIFPHNNFIHYSGWLADLEFLETWKSQGILWHLQNVREKSGNFMKLGKVREF